MLLPKFIRGWTILCALFLPGCSGSASLAGGSQAEKDNEEPRIIEPVTEEVQSQGSDAIVSEDVIDLNQRVIPPQVIAGSYLTCSFAEDGQLSDRAFYGCTARDAADNRLDLSDVKTDWTISAVGGANIDAVEQPLPEGSEYHRYWSLNAMAADLALAPTLTVYDESGVANQIAVKGVVTIE